MINVFWSSNLFQAFFLGQCPARGLWRSRCDRPSCLRPPPQQEAHTEKNTGGACLLSLWFVARGLSPPIQFCHCVASKRQKRKKLDKNQRITINKKKKNKAQNAGNQGTGRRYPRPIAARCRSRALVRSAPMLPTAPGNHPRMRVYFSQRDAFGRHRSEHARDEIACLDRERHRCQIERAPPVDL